MTKLDRLQRDADNAPPGKKLWRRFLLQQARTAHLAQAARRNKRARAGAGR